MNELFVRIITSTTFQQFFPFIVLFVVPFTAIFLVKTGPSLVASVNSLVMVLESLLPWNWGSSGTSGVGRTSHHEKKRSRKKSSRASEEVEIGAGNGGSYDGYYPGLVNISGTYCFMNSTVQALSSLSYLQPHLDAIHGKAELLDVPSPVVDTLRDLCRRLNTPHSRYSSIRPVDLISVLTSQSEASGRSNSLFNSREHQDAQELFQLLSECIKSEISAIDRESARDRGLGGLSQATEVKELGKSVFDGLTANRRSCVVCGYTEAVMHFPLDNWQLAVPQMTSACLLEDCFSDYTRLEVLRDCICRKCSMLATHRRLLGDIETLSKVENPSTSKRKRLREIKRTEAKVKAAIEEGRIEDEIPEVRMEKVFSAMSTKQAMIARPPPVLALHINRSMHFTHYAAKNNVRVLFPEVLDLTPFTTSGNLSIIPTSSMSTPTPVPQRSSFSPSASVSTSKSRSETPIPETQKDALSRTIYRLSAVVCHYGAHSYGHYVCYRRKPRNSAGGERWRPPKLVMETAPSVKQEPTDPDLDADNSVAEENPEGFEDYVWDDFDPSTAPGTGKGWLRVSDDSVSECGIETVLQEGSGAFMLYYEHAIISPYPLDEVTAPTNGSAQYDSPYPVRNGVNGGYQGVGIGVGTPLDSEETLKPETTTTLSSISINPDASVSSLPGSVGSVKEKMLSSHMNGSWGSSSVSGSPPVFGPRVIRSVAAGRTKRSSSAGPSLNGSIALSTNLSSAGDSGLLSSSLPSESPPGPSLTTKPIPVPLPNGNSRQHNDLDGFESIDALSVSGSPARASSLPTQLGSSLSTSSLTSTSPLSSNPSHTTATSVSPSPSAKKRKHKSKGHSHTPQHPPQSPIVDLKA
ncbi:ubiquitin-specific protease ubp1 [Marasmius tenuissimus]|nr:ubiquitin-specific protease ubp1 [Marasmius tenuissimus]